METDELFYEIPDICSEKKVISCCKKLQKKSRLTSQAAAVPLCDLAYWLYVYGHEDTALRVCEFSHLDFPEPGKINYGVWDFILFIWGLEAYIYRKKGDEKRCRQIVGAMQHIWLTPNAKFDTPQTVAARNKRANDDLTFDNAVSKQAIETCIAMGNKKSANEYRFNALKTMIGDGVTGLYPQLEERRDELEEKILEYISLLK